jgi:hypothetical protein
MMQDLSRLAETQRFVSGLMLVEAASEVTAARWFDRLRSGSYSCAESSSRRRESDQTWMLESSDPVMMQCGVATTQDTA